MANPDLHRGDKGKNVVMLQTLLNRVGAMLIADGDFGRGTERAVRYAQAISKLPTTGWVDSGLWSWLEAQPESSKLIDSNGVAFIAKEETGGLDYYEAVTAHPHFPGAASGITIGVGYDLRFNSLQDFEDTWSEHIPAVDFAELSKDIGKKGSKQRVKQLKELAIKIPFSSAWQVFCQSSIPRYYAKTEKTFPSTDKLPMRCKTALLSLVFNRGTSLSGPRRKEMKNIQSILQQADDPALGQQQSLAMLAGVEDEILSMMRLWNPSSGLIKRRQAEANLWHKGLNF